VRAGGSDAGRGGQTSDRLDLLDSYGTHEGQATAAASRIGREWRADEVPIRLLWRMRAEFLAYEAMRRLRSLVETP
jgi:hypothetical protein